MFKQDSLAMDVEENLILDCIPSIISLEENEVLLKTILFKEVEEIVFKMKKGKALGPDGFPIEFFEEFWEVIKFDLLGVVQ